MKFIVFISILLSAQLSSAQYLSGNAVTSVQDDMMITTEVDVNNEMVTLTLTGRNGAWYGFGFGSQFQNGTYAIVIDKDGNIEERKLGNLSAGTVLLNSLSLIENTVLSDIRTVTLTRPVIGLTSDHYTFPLTEGSIEAIWARGADGGIFSFHIRYGAFDLSLTDIDPIFNNGFE